MSKSGFLLALAALASVPGAANAHAALVTSSPTANATIAKTNAIRLTFNEKVVARFSGAELVMTGMPGMAKHAPMQMKGLKLAWSSDGKTLTLTNPKPLASGSYIVNWHAAGADTHRRKGSFSFSVK
ncbi:MAG: copper homeostasis periplasmic binding protein CopC [Qipengyuania sp.]|nr:copper homeostasis periplasmic binding protein CopC [Qipengyuania sp.]